jgi:nucleoside-diphosphate-sugar epimerase
VKQKVLILGEHGFIGNHLKSRLNQVYEVIEFNRKTQTLDEVVSENLPDIVINCSASKASATIMESYEANIKFQMECIQVLLKLKAPAIKWIQVASYFELQIPMGRIDNYTLDKQICRSILHRLEATRLIQLTTIYLPHIFGKGEDANRLIPMLTNKLQNGELAEISRGEQFLPILGIEDCCSAIIAAISTNQLICSAMPIWYDRVKLLALIMEKAISKGEVRPNITKRSLDDTFPRVDFPPPVKNWIPNMTFNDFISELESPKRKK